MNDQIKIRDIVLDDFEKWLPLWEGYNSFYKRVIPKSVTQTTFDRFLDPGEAVFGLVAEKDGKILGLVHFLFHRNTSVINDICYLQDLFTAKEARNMGVGRALILEVYKRAETKECPRVYWQTETSNETAKILYDKLAKLSNFQVYWKSYPEFTESRFS